MLKRLLTRGLESLWYQKNPWAYGLIPFAWLYQAIVTIRRFLYKKKYFAVAELPIPIIVIGNISVGGTGKTPLLIWMARFLQRQGYHPGIISRGYGGKAQQWPQRVNADSDPALVGDEALVIARQTQCPMAVGPMRVDTIKLLLEQSQCDLILSDDGLQHLGLARDIEIAVIDGKRRFGNGHCLPAGPLREPVSRLQDVDLKIVNGVAQTDEYAMQIIGDTAINLKTGGQKPLAMFDQKSCHAVAGVGNPERFFRHLENQGLQLQRHVFPDHYDYQEQDLAFADDAPILMTEKDAVKCVRFATRRHWYLPIQAQPDPAFAQQLLTLLTEIK